MFKMRYIPSIMLVISIVNAHEKDPIELIINLNNGQQASIAQNTPCLACAQYFGDTFKKCLRFLSQDDFKKTFFGINAYGRKAYLEDLSIEEHADMLHRFTEEDWQKERAQLTDEQKKFLPKTIKEQWDIIRQAQDIDVKKIDYECRGYRTTTPVYENHPCGPNRHKIAEINRYKKFKKALLMSYK